MRLLLLLPFALAMLVFAQPTPPAGMVYVPTGEFIMGSNRQDPTDFNQRDNVGLAYNDARPQHAATAGEFFIDVTEVTNAQYQKYCVTTGAIVPPHWKNGQFPTDETNFPVHHVNWYEAKSYAKWAGKRLPTEIEWEKAARGTDGRSFPWGDTWEISRVSGADKEVAVGQSPTGVSPYGALDMAGNTAEWTASSWTAYPGSPTQQRGFGDKYIVVRGGAWIVGQMLNQTFYREVARRQSQLALVGFRCARREMNS